MTRLFIALTFILGLAACSDDTKPATTPDKGPAKVEASVVKEAGQTKEAAVTPVEASVAKDAATPKQ